MTGEQLKELLEMLDIKPSLAHRLFCVDHSTVWYWLKGRIKIPPATQIAIYGALLANNPNFDLIGQVEVMDRIISKQGLELPQWDELRNSILFAVNNIKRIKHENDID